jgi:hypothetical protein
MLVVFMQPPVFEFFPFWADDYVTVLMIVKSLCRIYPLGRWGFMLHGDMRMNGFSQDGVNELTR